MEEYNPGPEIGSEPFIENKEEDFKPTGAIAFFVLLIILGLIIWFGIYFIMINRQ